MKGMAAEGVAVLFHRLEGLVEVNRVVVVVVVLAPPEPVAGPVFTALEGVIPEGVADSFLALDVVGFIKLKLALGVVRRAFTGLEGLRVIVAEDVILMGLERAVMLGVDVVGFITLLENPFLVKSC